MTVPRSERLLLSIVERHLKAAAREGADRYVALGGETSGSGGLMVLGRLARDCMFSLGCSIASDSTISEEQRAEMRKIILDDMAAGYDEGVSRPGEGEIL